MTDIMLFGRWLHECSAREYIRRGEVAVLRARGQLNQQHQCRLRLWNMAASNCWSTFDLLCHGKLLQSHLARVNQESFDLFERRILICCNLTGWWVDGESCVKRISARLQSALPEISSGARLLMSIWRDASSINQIPSERLVRRLVCNPVQAVSSDICRSL